MEDLDGVVWAEDGGRDGVISIAKDRSGVRWFVTPPPKKGVVYYPCALIRRSKIHPTPTAHYSKYSYTTCEIQE